MQNWEYKKLGDVCEVLNGYAFKSAQYVEEGIRVIRITNVQNGYIVDDEPKFYPLEKEKILSDYMLNDGDLLISLTGNCGRVGILTEDFLPAALNQRVACLRLKDDSILKSYLFHILNTKSFEIKCMDEATGAAQKNMSTEWLKKQEFVFPPLEEQKQIVKILDVKFAQLETVKANAKANFQNAKDLFQSQLTKAFSNTTWEKKRLGEIAETCLGKMLDKNKNKGTFQPYLANLNVRWGSFDIENLSQMKFEDDENERYGIKNGDLIVCEGGEPGRCAVWKDEVKDMKIQKALHRVRCSSSLFNFFLFYWFVFLSISKRLEDYCSGATIKHLTGEKLKVMEIPLPPLPEQKRIVEQLDSLSEKVRFLEEIYTKQLANCDELKHAFLAKAFNGEL